MLALFLFGACNLKTKPYRKIVTCSYIAVIHPTLVMPIQYLGRKLAKRVEQGVDTNDQTRLCSRG